MASAIRILAGIVGVISVVTLIWGDPLPSNVKSTELQRLLDRILVPPQIRPQPGFSARLLVAPGEMYDPLWMRSNGKTVWISDDGGMDNKGRQGSIWSVDEHGQISPLVGLGRFSMGPPLGLDLAPPTFGTYGGQIFTISQAEPLAKGTYDRSHLVQRIDLTQQNKAETFCTLPPGGFPDDRGVPAGGNDAIFGPDGSPFAGKLFVATFSNVSVYQVTADGRCAPFVTFDPGKWGSPVGLTFTPDGQHLLVSMYVGAEGVPGLLGKVLPGRATIARVRPDGTIEPEQLVRSSPTRKISIWQMAYAPKSFGEYAGQLFMAATNEKFGAGQQLMGNTPPEAGEVYRLTPEGELKLVATGLRASTGLAFNGNRLWVSDVNGDYISMARRELPDGFVVEITPTAP